MVFTVKLLPVVHICTKKGHKFYDSNHIIEIKYYYYYLFFKIKNEKRRENSFELRATYRS